MTNEKTKKPSSKLPLKKETIRILTPCADAQPESQPTSNRPGCGDEPPAPRPAPKPKPAPRKK